MRVAVQIRELRILDGGPDVVGPVGERLRVHVEERSIRLPPNATLGYMDQQEATAAAIEAAGGPQRVSDVFGISHVSVIGWRKRGQVPAERVIALEQLCEARVTRYELRPDIYPR